MSIDLCVRKHVFISSLFHISFLPYVYTYLLHTYSYVGLNFVAQCGQESRTALAETDSEVGTNTNSGGPGTRGALTAGPTLDSASTVHESDLDAVSVAASHTTDFTHSGVGGISGSAAGANTEGSKSLQSHSYSSCAGCETEKECCEDELTEARLHAFEEANIDGDAGTGAFDDEVLDALRSQFPHIDFKVREI